MPVRRQASCRRTFDLRLWRPGLRRCGLRRITRALLGGARAAFATFRAFPPCLVPLALSRPGQAGGPEVASFRASAPCGSDPAPGETAHTSSRCDSGPHRPRPGRRGSRRTARPTPAPVVLGIALVGRWPGRARRAVRQRTAHPADPGSAAPGCLWDSWPRPSWPSWVGSRQDLAVAMTSQLTPWHDLSGCQRHQPPCSPHKIANRVTALRLGP